MPSLIYVEEQGDLSPTTATFSDRSQSCGATYLFAGPTFDQLRTSIVDVLGFTDTRVSDGRIRRALPARHGAYQWLFADTVSPQAVGISHSVISPSPGPGGHIIPQVPLYAQYHYRISFATRPYNVWQDKDITVTKNVTGYDKTGASYTFAFATEWHRFTEFIQKPTNEFISAQQGQMVFRCTGPGGSAQPDTISFQDSPKLYLPNSLLTVKWHGVPYRYVTSPKSFITRFIGHLNQRDFNEGPLKAGDTASYPKGSLLFLGATPTAIYYPPIPDEGILAFNFGGGGFTRSKLCDLELNFLYTARTNGAASGQVYTPSNANWIVGGHNLLPWLTTRKFYYATSYDPNDPDTQSKWFPSYNSFPFELLFTDPDAATSPNLTP